MSLVVSFLHEDPSSVILWSGEDIKSFIRGNAGIRDFLVTVLVLVSLCGDMVWRC